MFIGRCGGFAGVLIISACLLIGCDPAPAQPKEGPTAGAGATLPAETASAALRPTVGAVTSTATLVITAPTTTLPGTAIVASRTVSSTLDLLAGRLAISFQSFRDGEEGLYLMREDGQGQMRWRAGADPAWSPDGRRLAFSQVQDNRDTLYVLDTVGTAAPTRLAAGFSPYWSPDGRMLAFADTRQGNADIFVINVDGTAERVLRRSPANEVDPCWAPDGRRLAFERGGQIVISGLDGVDLAVLAEGKTYASHPAWSPDGTRLAFSWRSKDTNGDGVIDLQDDSQIAVMNVDGTHRALLTAFTSMGGKPVWAQHPAWSPDGGRLAFESNRDGKWDIYMMKTDGSGLKNLTGDVRDSVNVSPAWRPVGR
jgi:dipeptidyl aminopeptidase/acylaminoacyl peptidase